MSLKGGNSGRGKEVKYAGTPEVPKLTLDFAPRDLKIKLPNKFNRDRSKLEPFLAQYELYMAFNAYKFKTET